MKGGQVHDLKDDAEAGLLMRATATEYSMLRLSGNPDGSRITISVGISTRTPPQTAGGGAKQ